MKTIFAILIVFCTTHLLANDAAVVHGYIEARNRTLSKGSTSSDVSRVLAFMSEDVVVEHRMANAIVNGRDAVGRGIDSHRDEYTGSPDESGISVLSSIAAPGVVAMKTRTTFVVGEAPARQVVHREGIMIIEIRQDRISRIVEY